MLVTLNEILEPAVKGGYAVIAPDFLNASMLSYYLEVAEKYQTPVIASYPPLPVDRLRNFDRWTGVLRSRCDSAKVPVCLHLDHGKDPQTCFRAIKAGFTSVMIDASIYEFEQNLEQTRQVVKEAKKHGVSVEAEIGHVGAYRFGIESSTTDNLLTDPDEAGSFAERSGIDALAVSIGTQHGQYKGKPDIDFKRLQALQDRVRIPLVLHGGSGTGDENIRKTIKGGIRKINVFTDIIKPYLKATLNGLKPWHIKNRKMHQQEAVERILKSYFEVSGSLGRGSI